MTMIIHHAKHTIPFLSVYNLKSHTHWTFKVAQCVIPLAASPTNDVLRTPPRRSTIAEMFRICLKRKQCRSFVSGLMMRQCFTSINNSLKPNFRAERSLE